MYLTMFPIQQVVHYYGCLCTGEAARMAVAETLVSPVIPHIRYNVLDYVSYPTSRTITMVVSVQEMLQEWLMLGPSCHL